MGRRLSLLYLSPHVPVPVSSAARLRTYNWLVHLSRHFDIHFLAAVRRPVQPDHIDAVRGYCSQVSVVPLHARRCSPRGFVTRVAAEAIYLRRGLPPEGWFLQHGAPAQALQEATRAQQFDVVFAERWTWGPAALAAAPVSVLDGPALQAARDAEELRRTPHPLRRLLRWHLLPAHAQLEARTAAAATLVLARGAAERKAAESLGGGARAVPVPPGVCTRYFVPRPAVAEQGHIVFFGSTASPACRDALVYLHREIMPAVRVQVPLAHLTVVDEGPIPELAEVLHRDPWLRFTGPLDDERIALWRAAVAVMPLRFGSGTTAKLAELLALGIPVVTSPAAARGLDLRSGEGILIAKNEAEFVRTIVQVLVDASLRGDLAYRARTVAQRRLSLDATYDRLSTLLAEGLTTA
jgi:polysaccharide biosynthesis protein PslH